MADHIHNREVQVCDLSAKTNPEPKGRTQRPDIWAHAPVWGQQRKKVSLIAGLFHIWESLYPILG
jgi:hypothetical protein